MKSQKPEELTIERLTIDGLSRELNLGLTIQEIADVRSGTPDVFNS
jgi:hypothetical protein